MIHEVVYVESEDELVKAIDNTWIGGSKIIVLNKDVTLTATVTIPAYKEITIKSNNDNNFKIIGIQYKSTI
ncbi:MAG: hypothetical protein LBE76_07180 [Nitrososphaerota archaeon]|jgi:hypothetical protein|nr:hypothetical protein [Nitrososphaerota archaeon]